MCRFRKGKKTNLKIMIDNNFKDPSHNQRLGTEVMKIDHLSMNRPAHSEVKNYSENLFPSCQSPQSEFDNSPTGAGKNKLQLLNMRANVRSCIVNSPMPQNKLRSNSEAEKSNQKSQSDPEEAKSEAFFGKDKEKVWKNALQCNTMNEKFKNTKQDSPQKSLNPFKNEVILSETSSQKQTPGFNKKDSDMFKFKVEPL